VFRFRPAARSWPYERGLAIQLLRIGDGLLGPPRIVGQHPLKQIAAANLLAAESTDVRAVAVPAATAHQRVSTGATRGRTNPSRALYGDVIGRLRHFAFSTRLGTDPGDHQQHRTGVR